tara:strand:+ start:410 stop:1168 length:759 start_codon:yes stop_codon:yes gene_type:complete
MITPIIPTDKIIWFYFLLVSSAVFLSSYFVFSVESRLAKEKSSTEESTNSLLFNIYCVVVSFIVSLIFVAIYVFFFDIPILGNTYYLYHFDQKTNGFVIAISLCLTFSLMSPLYLSWFKNNKNKIYILFSKTEKTEIIRGIIYFSGGAFFVALIFTDWDIILQSLALNLASIIVLLIYFIPLLIFLKPFLATVIMTVILIIFSMIPYFPLQPRFFVDYDEQILHDAEMKIFLEELEKLKKQTNELLKKYDDR